MQCVHYYRVFPAILRINVGIVLNQAFSDFDPSMKRGNVKPSPIIIISGLNQRPIFLQQLPDRNWIVLVSVPLYQRRPAHFSLIPLLPHHHRRGISGRSPELPSLPLIQFLRSEMEIYFAPAGSMYS